MIYFSRLPFRFSPSAAHIIVTGVVVKKNKKTGAAKFKIRCSRYLCVTFVVSLTMPRVALYSGFQCLTSPRVCRYTLVVDDKDKAAKFERDLPKALSPS